MCGVREKRRRVGTCSGSINSSTWKCKRWLVEDETVVQRKSRLLNYKMTMNRGDGPGRGRVVICVAGGQCDCMGGDGAAEDGAIEQA